MSIKGLREALEKKRLQQHPEQQDTDGTVKAAQRRRSTGPVPRPHKKITGRGR